VKAKGSTKGTTAKIPGKKQPTKKAAVGAAIKVDSSKLDHLIDMVGELLIAQNMVTQHDLLKTQADPGLQRNMLQLNRTTSALQNTAMGMRMVPIDMTFKKMFRLVRDVSQKIGKKIDLEVVGENTEVDRMMVDALYDPLVHMIRNSCDHGIATPAERKAAGKQEIGTIHLEARHQGGSLVIEITDDGRGIPTPVIRKKAIEKGLIRESAQLSEQEILQLIFAPGFSTAEQITDVSGRGVGMDVVKSNIEALRGKVEIYSEVGKGTTFLIRLPLTLAIIDGMVVSVGKEIYIIPTLSVRESLQPERDAYQKIQGKGETVLLRNAALPLFRLQEHFQIEAPPKPPWESVVVVLEHGERRCGLVVDRLVGKQEVVIKSLGEKFKQLKEIAGCSILGNGQVALILDVAYLTSLVSGKSSKARAP